MQPDHVAGRGPHRRALCSQGNVRFAHALGTVPEGPNRTGPCFRQNQERKSVLSQALVSERKSDKNRDLGTPRQATFDSRGLSGGYSASMGFVRQRALERCKRVLAPFLKEGETILEFDVGKSDRGQRVDLIATTKALYVYIRGVVVRRLPYEEIATYVSWEPALKSRPDGAWRLIVTPTPLHRQNPMPLWIDQLGPGTLGQIVKDRVQSLVTFERHVPHREDGDGATYRFRPWEEGGKSVWDVVFDPSIKQPESEEWQSVMMKTISQLRQERGAGGAQ